MSDITRQALDGLIRQRVPERLRERDHTVWRPAPREITDRLGWLDAGSFLRPHLPDLAAFVNEICAEGYRDVVLLGMGGSSLGPEVLRRSFVGNSSLPKDNPRLTLLDSTVPGQVAAVTQAVDPAHTLFIVSSKSGGTIETLSFYRHFRHLTENSLSLRGRVGVGESPGLNFVAITDAGTPLERLGREAGFRRVFLNPADIGGRYSVLSWFGMLPAALAGIDVARLLDTAASMRDRCLGDDAQANPGLQLGALLGAMTLAGRDKVTLITPPPIDSFGLWVEQMIAESLGKEGRGIVPVAGEPLLSPDCYGDDRLFIYLRTGRGGDEPGLHWCDDAVERLETAGHPVARLELTSVYDLGAEFFRWEYATAIAGSMLDVHPFDQPDVQSAKDNTDVLLETFLSRGSLPELPTVYLAGQPAEHQPEAPAGHQPESPVVHQPESPTAHQPEAPAVHQPESSAVHPELVEGSVASLLEQALPGDYLAIVSYMPVDAEADRLLDELRSKIMERYCIATTAGYGPRYLHSTGQLHKGGPGSGLYLQLTTNRSQELPIPGQPYGFDVLAAAQAIGDYQALTNLGRRLVSLNLGDDPISGLRRLLEEF